MLAAWAYHHAHEITPFDVQRGFYDALSMIWPGREEQKGSSRERVRLAYLLGCRGVANSEIASALNVSEAAVEKYRRRGRDKFEADPAPLHEIVANRRPGGAEEPPDPGTAEDLIRTWLPPSNSDDLAAEMAAVEKAKELGIDLFSATGTDEPFMTEPSTPDGTGNPAPSAAHFDAAEARLRANVEADLPVLVVVRQATEVLSWALCQSDLPQTDEDPVPASHLVATAMLFLGVMAHRATRAAIALAAIGYEPETLGLKRLLTEAHSRMKAILDDASGQYAREWLVGPAPSTPHRVVAKHADREMFDLYSRSAHADAEGIKRWLLQPRSSNEWGVVGAPDRWPGFINTVMVEFAFEVRDIAVGLASIRGLTPPGLAALDDAINAAEKQYLVADDDGNDYPTT
jgi:hypothetical protein